MLRLFLIQGVLGCLAAFLLIPTRAAGRLFFRYAAAQSAVLAILALALSPRAGSWVPRDQLPLALTALLLSISAGLFHLARLGAGRWLLSAALPCSLAGVVREALLFVPAGQDGPRAALLYAADAVTSGLSSGFALVAMMLGHAYLNIPGLPIRHLERLSLAFLGAVALRAAVVAWGITTNRAAIAPLVEMLLHPSGEASLAPGLDPFVLVGLLIHILCGLAAPAAFAVMAWRSAAIGSTQSATGILYVALVVVIMGEMASRYLLTLTGLPL